jgi:hypothetical protein
MPDYRNVSVDAPQLLARLMPTDSFINLFKPVAGSVGMKLDTDPLEQAAEKGLPNLRIVIP